MEDLFRCPYSVFDCNAYIKADDCMEIVPRKIPTIETDLPHVEDVTQELMTGNNELDGHFSVSFVLFVPETYCTLQMNVKVQLEIVEPNTFLYADLRLHSDPKYLWSYLCETQLTSSNDAFRLKLDIPHYVKKIQATICFTHNAVNNTSVKARLVFNTSNVSWIRHTTNKIETRILKNYHQQKCVFMVPQYDAKIENRIQLRREMLSKNYILFECNSTASTISKNNTSTKNCCDSKKCLHCFWPQNVAIHDFANVSTLDLLKECLEKMKQFSIEETSLVVDDCEIQFDSYLNKKVVICDNHQIPKVLSIDTKSLQNCITLAISKRIETFYDFCLIFQPLSKWIKVNEKAFPTEKNNTCTTHVYAFDSQLFLLKNSQQHLIQFHHIHTFDEMRNHMSQLDPNDYVTLLMEQEYTQEYQLQRFLECRNLLNFTNNVPEHYPVVEQFLQPYSKPRFVTTLVADKYSSNCKDAPVDNCFFGRVWDWRLFLHNYREDKMSLSEFAKEDDKCIVQVITKILRLTVPFEN